MKMYKKMFAFLLALTLVLSGFNINAESVFAGEDTEAVLENLSTGVKTITANPTSELKERQRTFKLEGKSLVYNKTKAKVIIKGKNENITAISDSAVPLKADVDRDEAVNELRIKLTFPLNVTTEDIVYVVSFSVDGGKTFYDKKKDAHESNLSAEPVEITVKGNTDKPNPDVEPEKKPEIDKIDVSLLQGMASLSIKGKNLKQASFKAKVTLADGTELENFNEHAWISFLDNSSSTIITLPENNTEKDITYKIHVSIDGGKTYPANQAVTVTIPKKVVGADTEVIAISEKGNSVGEKKFDSKGGDVNLLVSTKEDTTYDKIKAKITQIVDGTEIAGDVFAQIDVKNTKSKSFKFNAHFPGNNGKKAKEYKVVFNAKGSDTEFQQEPVLKVIVDGKDVENAEKKVTIKSIKASVPGLPKTGGISNITIIGANLDLDKLDPSITKTIEGKTQKVELKVEKQGSDKAASFIITFPKAESDKVETYNITIGDKSVTVTVGGRVSGILQEILPSRVYTNKDKTVITVYYDEEIYAVADDYKELKEGITLQANNYGQITEIKLTDKDNVTIDANKLVISLATPFKGGINSKIIVEERLLKDKEGFEARKISQIIDIAKPIVNSSVFSKGEVLTKEGGEVELKLIGEGFVQSVGGVNKAVNTLVKVLENNKAKTELYGIKGAAFNRKNSDKIKVNTNEEGTEQTIGFTLPANDTGKTKTYSVMVSLDGGLTYSSALGVNILENRAKRLVASVLPTDENDGNPSLSFMSITSYGTQGGGKEEADITHTETPNGQESKKTWVTAFGANLDKSLTKIRIIDRNGIIWYPLQNEGTSDSTSNFIMVSSDGTGIFGNGNTQMLEVIGMNNILTTETFTYQLAVDGKNYDTETVVTVTVPYDGGAKNTKKEMTEDFIRSVKVSHVTDTGKVLEAETEVRGYSWSKLRSFGIRAKEFANCKVLGYRKDGSEELTPMTGLNEGNVENLKSVQFVYEEKAPVIEPTAPVIPSTPVIPIAPAVTENFVENVIKPGAETKDITKDGTPLGGSKENTNQSNSKKISFSTSKETFKISKAFLKALDKSERNITIAVKNGEVTLSGNELKNTIKGSSYLKIVKKNNAKEVKKALKSKKHTGFKAVYGKRLYEVKLVVNGKNITKTASALTVSLKAGKTKKGSIYVLNLKTGKKIKAKYDKKTKSVVFSTKELGKFVVTLKK
jgi:hypothetical protein